MIPDSTQNVEYSSLAPMQPFTVPSNCSQSRPVGGYKSTGAILGKGIWNYIPTY